MNVHLSPVGSALRQWRQARGVSQLALAMDADTSARHVSFIETGRSQPSRNMVLRLSHALDLPFRGKMNYWQLPVSRLRTRNPV